MIGLTMLFFSRRMRVQGLWIWKAVESFKWVLMGSPSRNMKDFVAEIDLNCVVLAQYGLVEMNFSMHPRVFFFFWYLSEKCDCSLSLSKESN